MEHEYDLHKSQCAQISAPAGGGGSAHPAGAGRHGCAHGRGSETLGILCGYRSGKHRAFVAGDALCPGSQGGAGSDHSLLPDECVGAVLLRAGSQRRYGEHTAGGGVFGIGRGLDGGRSPGGLYESGGRDSAASKGKEIDIVVDYPNTNNILIEVKYREGAPIADDDAIVELCEESSAAIIITKNADDFGVHNTKCGKDLLRIPAFAFLSDALMRVAVPQASRPCRAAQTDTAR